MGVDVVEYFDFDIDYDEIASAGGRNGRQKVQRAPKHV